MTNCKTFNNISFILLFCTFAVCENSNSTKYCVVDGDSPGITLSDGLGKDSTYAGKFVLLQFYLLLLLLIICSRYSIFLLR
jgi:hypothetical protein